jgi:hypothetical protein
MKKNLHFWELRETIFFGGFLIYKKLMSDAISAESIARNEKETLLIFVNIYNFVNTQENNFRLLLLLLLLLLLHGSITGNVVILNNLHIFEFFCPGLSLPI